MMDRDDFNQMRDDDLDREDEQYWTREMRDPVWLPESYTAESYTAPATSGAPERRGAASAYHHQLDLFTEVA